ncbi:MAG: AMP-binding protein [Acidimicrobiia bacterium]|nr:AMP-binding protein [Acidimicrobiia bacterium]
MGGTLNLADAFDAIAAVRGDGVDAVVQRDRHISWADFERRAANLGAWMLEQGASLQGKVAAYTYNHPAYNETCYAAWKARLVPFNVNYRYREAELQYLLDNADTEFVVVHAEFVPLLAKVVGELPQMRGVLVVDDGDGQAAAVASTIDGAVVYEDVAETAAELPAQDRDWRDQMFLYTGGTTGMPKGVMWQQGDLYEKLGGGGIGPSPETIDDLVTSTTAQPAGLRGLVGCPLMHGTGWFTSIIALLTGGTVVLMDDPKHFDPAEFWTIIEREKPQSATIVGDSFARPLVRELEREGAPDYDLSSLLMMVSSGVMWSTETKQALLAHNPTMMLVDAFSSSEALGMGQSIMTAAGPVPTAKFQLTATTRLFDEELQPLETAPGVRGLVGVGAHQPLGYYKDPEKTATTFTEIDGMRYSVPGDWAEVADDGVTLNLLGRGSVCINTGGEKVYPEEVEEVVKQHPSVGDCVVVGVPDDKFGQAITAVVSCLPGEAVTESELKDFVKERISGYKAPRHVVVVDSVYRSPSGKADYKQTLATALEHLA